MRETLPWGGHHIYDLLVARRLQRFYDRLATARSVQQVLDIGCGPGHLAAAIARANPSATVIGMDMDPVQVRLAQRHQADNLGFRAGRSDATGLPGGSVDWVLATETFHHWKHPRPSLDEIARVLRPGGEFWIVEGAGDMTAAEFEAWTGRAPFPLLMPWVRAVFRRHGYSTKRLRSELLPLLEQGPFQFDVERQDGWWIMRGSATRLHR